jgi:fatty acid desaturase
MKITQVTLAEERTVLSYVRTFIAMIGLVMLVLKLYFEQEWWVTVVIVMFAILALLVLHEEVVRFRKKRAQ